jgi:hypothetical protein
MAGDAAACAVPAVDAPALTAVAPVLTAWVAAAWIVGWDGTAGVEPPQAASMTTAPRAANDETNRRRCAKMVEIRPDLLSLILPYIA